MKPHQEFNHNSIGAPYTVLIGGEGEFTRNLKSGKINYFLDVKEAKNSSRYVSITESQPSKEDPKKFSKRSITVFNNAANDFIGAMEEVVGQLKM